MTDSVDHALAPYRFVYAHRIYFHAPPFEEVNAIAADAVQNLRQALDHAACACARAVGKTDKSTYFPLIKAGEDLEAKIKNQAQKLPPTIKDIIRRYEPGGGLLSELHVLSVADKHRQICDFKFLAQARLNKLQAGSGWVAAGLGEDEWDPAANCLNFALSGTPAETDYDFDFTAQILFNTDGIIATKPAVLALDEFADTVDQIIGEMEREVIRITTPGMPADA